jgi:predicted alpha/beta-hydrolase family hydrolase
LDPLARFEEVKIPLLEPVHGLEAVSGVLGVPEWWPTGARVSIVLAHGSTGSKDEPLLVALQQALTERKYLTLRFNFPFAEAGKKRPDPFPVLERTLRHAIATLGRDPTAAPAHLFIGGRGLGARVAANLATTQVRVDGLFFLGFPLHPPGSPAELRVDRLFRIVSPMIFVQGTRDRQCEIPVLRKTLLRVGAPTALHVVEEADQSFKVPRKTGRSDVDVHREIFGTLDTWIGRVLGA